ncbi:MAG TPA: signal peptide peptidase SppA [Thermoanaerobaculia bacterium]|nr:signal peptide peptidase SppA [Thermoanaerobaculia bacterium]
MSDETNPSRTVRTEEQSAPAALPARRSSPMFWIILGLFLFSFVAFTALATIVGVLADRSTSTPLWIPKARVGIVHLEGGIFDVSQTIDQLDRYGRNRSIKAIVLRINSPGGAIVPSQELFSEIRRIRKESGKPIVASIDSVAASGGYYVAVACDSIVANPGSITGSIGVIMQWMNLEELLNWAKLKPETFVSGPMKNVGSPFHESTDSEKAHLQGIVSQLHLQFVRAVADGRKGKLTEDEVSRLADGRVFTGEQAKKLRLVDEVGGLTEAVELAGRMAGIKGRPSTVTPRVKQNRGLLDALIGSARTDRIFNRIIAHRSVQFLYQW